MKTPILILPGLSSSGPDHWQSRWEQDNPEYIRVEQKDWFDPNPQNWISIIEDYVRHCQFPPILVPHSLATIAVAHWASTTKLPIRGAFIVAPADVETPGPHADLLKSFAPIPEKRLPFPSIVIASSNDPYCCIERATELAKSWGSQMVIAGALGHINASSGLGNWPQGKQIFQDWLSTLP